MHAIISTVHLMSFFLLRDYSINRSWVKTQRNMTKRRREEEERRRGGGGMDRGWWIKSYVLILCRETTKLRLKSQPPLQILRNIRIRLSAQLRLPLQRLRRIEPIHHNLHELDRLARSERGRIEQFGELFLCVDGVGFRTGLEIGGGEDFEELRPFPVRVKTSEVSIEYGDGG